MQGKVAGFRVNGNKSVDARDPFDNSGVTFRDLRMYGNTPVLYIGSKTFDSRNCLVHLLHSLPPSNEQLTTALSPATGMQFDSVSWTTDRMQ